MATVNDNTTTEAPPRVTATVEVGGETLTVDSATPGSAMHGSALRYEDVPSEEGGCDGGLTR